MAPRMYDMGDYVLYLCEDEDGPFITYERPIFSPYVSPVLGKTNVVRIRLSSEESDQVFVIIDCFGWNGRKQHYHKLSNNSNTVIIEAVKILTDHLMRRAILEQDTT